jgi:hypothetical protein
MSPAVRSPKVQQVLEHLPLEGRQSPAWACSSSRRRSLLNLVAQRGLAVVAEQ